MDVTPKKLLESSSRCSVCSSISKTKEKIYIFGKSSFDVAELIRSSLTVDVNCYAESSKLFVCRDKCYQHLIKFKKASDKLNEIKKEIEEVFNAREKPRAKRLLRSEEEHHFSDEELIEETVKTTTPTRGKASKSLRFADTADTTCTSSKGSDSLGKTIVASKTPLAYLSPIQSHPHGLVLRAFPNSHTGNINEFRPRSTLMPISSNHGSTSETSQVRVSVKYPSRTVNKPLSTYQAIGKALAHGFPSQIAGAVMKCQPLRNHITEKVLFQKRSLTYVQKAIPHC